MESSVDRLSELLATSSEDEHLEFKAAKSSYSNEKLAKYCAALANQRGGMMLLGVSDEQPRRVVGSNAFPDLEQTKQWLMDVLGIRIDAESINHSKGRVVVFQAPSRPIGVPIRYKDVYWTRVGGSIRSMTHDELKAIFDEAVPDFSAKVCDGAKIDDLDAEAIDYLRMKWGERSGNERLKNEANEQILLDCELLIDDGVTYAALILLGRAKSLSNYLAQAELVFEYRSSQSSIRYQQRKDFRKGFFSFCDTLWKEIDGRNEEVQYEDGLFVQTIQVFNEKVVREALLNAVSHRDYQHPGSVFVRQYPKRLEIVSPGPFPPGITVENILSRQYPRNRRIAEVLAKCGLVERSGQGADLMFSQSIGEAKARPDYSDSDDHQVSLVLDCEVKDRQFLRFLEEAQKRKQVSFSAADLLVLDSLRNRQQIPAHLKTRLDFLRKCGVVEKRGRKGYMLSKRLYDAIGHRGTYTRRRGLDAETSKALITQHLENYGQATISDFEDMFETAGLTRSQIHSLLRALRSEGKIECVGQKRGSKWILT